MLYLLVFPFVSLCDYFVQLLGSSDRGRRQLLGFSQAPSTRNSIIQFLVIGPMREAKARTHVDK